MIFTTQISGNKNIWLAFVLNMLLVIMLFFSSIFTGLYLSNQTLIEAELQSRARAFFKSIVTTRSWNAGHGGVYVEKRPGVESNPYLENLDIVTVDGKVYTMKNPALMTREISELAKDKGFFEFHITSLNPLNPENAADAFEERALKEFDTGASEKFEVFSEDGTSLMRYMAPLIVEEGCLKCHAKQGYKMGEVRGGISISFNIDEVQRRLKLNRIITMMLFVISSGLLLVIIYRLIRGLMNKINEYEIQLRETAITDALTKIYNRRHLEERLTVEIERAERYGDPLSCIMFDIDHFKAINDRFGHDSGDKVLIALADMAKHICRTSDLVARYGGEEFTVVLPDTAVESAFHVAEKLRMAIAATVVELTDGSSISATASFGVAELKQLEVSGDAALRALLNAADEALYQAKGAGRNCTFIHQAE